MVPKATTAQWNIIDYSTHTSYPQIPECEDWLPPEVNLGVLDMELTQKTDSNIPLLTWTKLDCEDYLLELLRLKGSLSQRQPIALLEESELSCYNTGLNLPKIGGAMLPPQDAQMFRLRDLDVLFVALNANFCPRYCAVLNNECNPSLSQGWGHLVEESAFKAYLSDHNNHIQEYLQILILDQKSTFSNHNAVNLADVKSKKGCDATGVGMLLIYNAEKDMDYAFVSALHNLEVTVLKILYDIACQWCKKFFQQMEKMPPSLQLHLHDQDITFLFPKFHLVTHIASCQWPFSFNWTKDVGQMDGREPECGWANLNAAASSPKDMGLSHCQNTLDDYL
ncbi:hypothetical protein J3A83DRAFT_4185700 [Scleroderma citrinum]